ncbi:hypothetical protein [Cerasicoccus maritimus]|uniref:hypothetical protein n=1 Tax=Cerasicoccus maritimus TaxID=490089 RepID=UPI002852758A|nr:hypothetical protein [Cerasicoccus maritimus]
MRPAKPTEIFLTGRSGVTESWWSVIFIEQKEAKRAKAERQLLKITRSPQKTSFFSYEIPLGLRVRNKTVEWLCSLCFLLFKKSTLPLGFPLFPIFLFKKRAPPPEFSRKE